MDEVVKGNFVLKEICVGEDLFGCLFCDEPFNLLRINLLHSVKIDDVLVLPNLNAFKSSSIFISKELLYVDIDCDKIIIHFADCKIVCESQGPTEIAHFIFVSDSEHIEFYM